MAVNIAINGFGRIGRLVFRAIAEQGMLGKDVKVVAVGDGIGKRVRNSSEFRNHAGTRDRRMPRWGAVGK